MQGLCPPGTSHPFTLQLLHNLRETVRSVVVAHMDRSRLREALLSSRHRAEVMHVVVQLGQQIKDAVDDERRDDWTKNCEAFYAMLDK
jgi:hypothetical protein